MRYYFEIQEDSTGKRIDKFLSENIDELSRSYIAALIEDKQIFVNRKAASKSYKLSKGDEIEFTVSDAVEQIGRAHV